MSNDKDAMATNRFSDLAVDRQSTADLIANAIRDQVLAGELEQGDFLREADMAAGFGVARNTIREALRLLTRDGIATHQVHRGVSIRRYTTEDIKDVFANRMILQNAAAARVGTLLPQELLTLEDALDSSARAARDGDMRGNLTDNLEFHRRIVGLVESPRLNSAFDKLVAEVRLIVADITGLGVDAWLIRNRRLLDELRAGTAASFTRSLGAYLEEAEDEILEARQMDA